MSWYRASAMLRELARRQRQRDHGVTSAQLDAARQALQIFAPPVLASLRDEWTADVLERTAQILERYGREDDTPTALLTKPPP